MFKKYQGETTTTLPPCADYLDSSSDYFVSWKGAKLSKLQRIGDTGISALVNIPVQLQTNWDYGDAGSVSYKTVYINIDCEPYINTINILILKLRLCQVGNRTSDL